MSSDQRERVFTRVRQHRLAWRPCRPVIVHPKWLVRKPLFMANIAESPAVDAAIQADDDGEVAEKRQNVVTSGRRLGPRGFDGRALGRWGRRGTNRSDNSSRLHSPGDSLEYGLHRGGVSPGAGFPEPCCRNRVKPMQTSATIAQSANERRQWAKRPQSGVNAEQRRPSGRSVPTCDRAEGPSGASGRQAGPTRCSGRIELIAFVAAEGSRFGPRDETRHRQRFLRKMGLLWQKTI